MILDGTERQTTYEYTYGIDENTLKTEKVP